MDWNRRDVAFAGHDGTTLRGWLYVPAGHGPFPAITMAHGFSATKEMSIDLHAEAFAAGGIAVLLYDHRSLGASDGEPRQLVDPWVQSRDMLQALSWLAVQPEVDPTRLGLWGTSFSAGEALVVGALDQRVKAVVATVPFVGQVSNADFAVLAQAVCEARVDPAALRGPRAVIPEDGAEDGGLMPAPESVAWFRNLAQKTEGRWKNSVLQPMPGAVEFNPAVAVPHLHGPALFIATREDGSAPAAAAEAVSHIAPPGSEFLLADGHHFSLYSGDGLTLAVDAARAFLLRHL